MRRALALLVLTLAGCGRNAYLEVDVVLPANATGQERYAVIAFAPDGQDFDAVWAGQQTLGGVKLSDGDTVTQHVSVEGNSDRFDQPVQAKVTFCGNATCTATGDDRAAEVRLRIERAFYEGERTSYTWTVACIPSTEAGKCAVADRAIEEVGKCDVAGCREGTSSNFCVGGKHFCEP